MNILIGLIRHSVYLGMIIALCLSMFACNSLRATSASQEDMDERLLSSDEPVSISGITTSSTESLKGSSTSPSRSATPPKKLEKTDRTKIQSNNLLASYSADAYFATKLCNVICRLPVGIVFREDGLVKKSFMANLQSFYGTRKDDLENRTLSPSKIISFNTKFYADILIGFKTIANDLQFLCTTHDETKADQEDSFINKKINDLQKMKAKLSSKSTLTKEERKSQKEKLYVAGQATYNIFTNCGIITNNSPHLTAFLKEIWALYQNSYTQDQLDQPETLLNEKEFYQDPLEFFRYAPTHLNTAQQAFKTKFEGVFKISLQHITFEEGHDATEIVLPPEKKPSKEKKLKRLKSALRKGK